MMKRLQSSDFETFKRIFDDTCPWPIRSTRTGESRNTRTLKEFNVLIDFLFGPVDESNTSSG